MLLVLDIDLDFFVSPIVYANADIVYRPDARHHAVTPTTEAIAYVEQRFCLNRQTPKRGCVLEEHSGAFDYLMRLDSSPFRLVHVDAHGDLGFSPFEFSPCYICEELLHRPVSARDIVHRGGKGGLASGNWLAFLLAQRRVSALELVYPDHWKPPPEHGDIPRVYWRSGRAEDGDIEMPILPEGGWRYLVNRGSHHPRASFEPAIRYRRHLASSFVLDRSPDVLLLTRSPQYSPVSADTLFDILKEYVNEEA